MFINESRNATFAGYVKAPFFTSDGGRGFKQDGVSFVSTYSEGSGANNANDLGSATNRWRNAYLNGGLFLGGTGNANNLDDYEEGTWTPQVYYQNSTDQANATNTVSQGTYTKIGNLVYVSFRLDFSQSGTPANDNIGVKNLPFAGANNHYNAGGNLITNTSFTGLNFQLPTAGSTLVVIVDSSNGGNFGDDFGTGSGKYIRGSFTYQA